MTAETTYRCLHEDPLPESDASMSNFDHVVEDRLADELADGEHMAGYAGWNFHAYVYRPGDVYVADVHRFHAHVTFIAAATLEDLMADVSDEYGYD